jgi:glycosyltransferase involved in cell wall biosynthesis
LIRLAYANDGISTYDELFLETLKEYYDVCVLTFHPSPSYIPEGIDTVKMADLVPEINLHPFEGMRKHLLTPIRAYTLKKALRRVKPDVLIGCWATTYGFYSACSKFHPYVLLVWGSDIMIFPKKYFPLKPLVLYSLRKADVVVVDSEVQRRAAIKLGCESGRIVKFPWVNLDEFKCDADHRRRIRGENGWTDEDIVVVSLRSHKPIYGVEYLVGAIPEVVKENKHLKLLILGDGPLTPIFKTMMAKYIESDHVKFVGTVRHDKIVDYLSAADIYVSTSFSDGTSASLLEAMSCSLPSVATEIDGNKEWINNGINGFLVPVADSKKLAEKILLLADDQELRRRLRANAEETMRTRVIWQENIKKLTNAIDSKLSI